MRAAPWRSGAGTPSAYCTPGPVQDQGHPRAGLWVPATVARSVIFTAVLSSEVTLRLRLGVSVAGQTRIYVPDWFISVVATLAALCSTQTGKWVEF